VNLVLDDVTAASPEAGSSCSLENYLALPTIRWTTALQRRAPSWALQPSCSATTISAMSDPLCHATGDSYKLSELPPTQMQSTSSFVACISWRRARTCSATRGQPGDPA